MCWFFGLLLDVEGAVSSQTKLNAVNTREWPEFSQRLDQHASCFRVRVTETDSGGFRECSMQYWPGGTRIRFDGRPPLLVLTGCRIAAMGHNYTVYGLSMIAVSDSLEIGWYFTLRIGREIRKWLLIAFCMFWCPLWNHHVKQKGFRVQLQCMKEVMLKEGATSFDGLPFPLLHTRGETLQCHWWKLQSSSTGALKFLQKLLGVQNVML